MIWRKLGFIFSASGQNNTMHSGGRAPVPFHLQNGVFRIYFASYDSLGRGRIFSLEIDLEQPQKILSLTTRPHIDFGDIGFYDDNGIIPSDVVQSNNKLYMYTIGFSIKNKLIFDAATGIAISTDNGLTFNKFTGPVIDRSVDDPCFAASPCVKNEKNQWKMWYVSCDKWEALGNNRYKHFYNIKYRESQDGVYWDKKAKVCINYKCKEEYAISRPSVLFWKNAYRMWYSFRAQPRIETYRIGYAESFDGINWTRKDEEMQSFDVSPSGWDSEMICYPYVFEHDNRLYMLYNGNGYGKTGFGLAVLEE